MNRTDGPEWHNKMYVDISIAEEFLRELNMASG